MCACVCVCVCACVCLNLHEMLKCAHNPNVHLLSFPIARHVMLVFYLPCIVSLAIVVQCVRLILPLVFDVFMACVESCIEPNLAFLFALLSCVVNGSALQPLQWLDCSNADILSALPP